MEAKYSIVKYSTELLVNNTGRRRARSLRFSISAVTALLAVLSVVALHSLHDRVVGLMDFNPAFGEKLVYAGYDPKSHAPYDDEVYLYVPEPVVTDKEALMRAYNIDRVSRTEYGMKNSTVRALEHDKHMAAMKRALDAEKTMSANLVDSAVSGVTASFGEMYSDADWPGAGRWRAPDKNLKTDTFEWPLPPRTGKHVDDIDMDLELGARQRMMLRRVEGPETGYYAQPGRAGLPRWRVPAGGDGTIMNPAGNVGSLGDYIIQQPRAKLVTTKWPAQFPVRVNGKFVDPRNPRPWQADKELTYNPWAGYYWSGKAYGSRVNDRRTDTWFPLKIPFLLISSI
jgi:hypothetical protein